MSRLSINNHDRDVAGYQYIYPVISRRSGGLSIGINFNTNNACNWRCVYCQVPNLKLGSAPDVDLDLLAAELAEFLQDVLHGSFYERFELEPEMRVIKDIAISGNGEPTSVKEFAKTIALIVQVVGQANIADAFQYVLITNGSLIHKTDVQQGLKLLHENKGQVWFKLDSATEVARQAINHSALNLNRQTENLLSSESICATWLQTCMLNYAGKNNVGLVSNAEQEAYLAMLKKVIQQTTLQGVMLYSLARPSLQPESSKISRVTTEQINDFANRIRALGLVVNVSL
ncbi:MAG: radical SAM protein [Gammaproteobacteria bacterium]|nr:radical SAM protein [Gammaproteobacteria bacterium]MBT6418787.1 radical SAM protein [Gammaproteobacteria bacterium]MBT6576725.1 radical SAM protein [Gammaproteobacteria bacterium]